MNDDERREWMDICGGVALSDETIDELPLGALILDAVLGLEEHSAAMVERYFVDRTEAGDEVPWAVLRFIAYRIRSSRETLRSSERRQHDLFQSGSTSTASQSSII